MRRLIRGDCPPSVDRVLQVRQRKVDSGEPVKVQWKSFSRLVAYRDLRTVLEAACGDRRRCAFCSDSMGADVEHFWPKEEFPGRCFLFENYLLACAVCNRKKGSKFPRDAIGQPLLVNPVYDDPWDSLFFDSLTGMLSPRVVAVSNGSVQLSRKGSATIDVLGDVLNSEPVRIGRSANWARVIERFSEYMDGFYDFAVTRTEVFKGVDDYGLAEWLVAREGKEETPIVEIRNGCLDRWVRLRDMPR